METFIERYQKELDRCHRVIKESNDFETKRKAVREAALLTARYLDERYREEGLYNYRKIERMAARLPEMVREQLETAERYYGQSTMRADIALNSLGLDLFIMHTNADEIATTSNKAGASAGKKPKLLLKRIITRIRIISSMWAGHHRRDDDTATERAVEQLQMLPEDEASGAEGPNAEGDSGPQ
jgi:hypothetical protein